MDHQIGPSHCTAEASLLLSCARTAIDSQTLERLRDLVHQGIDWQRVATMARRHGMLPLLYRNLAGNLHDGVPEAALTSMQKYFDANGIQMMLMTRALGDVMNIFTTSGIRAIPYKGLLLAIGVYKNAALRQTSDLDVLVHPRDYSRTKELLLSQGWRISIELAWKDHLDGPVDHPSFRHLNIDLHRALVPEWYGFAIDFDGLWARRAAVAMAGTTYNTFSPEDLLVLLCLDLTKDMAEARPFGLRLKKVTDIVELIGQSSQMDWRLLLQLTKQIDAQGVLSLGLLVADHLYGVSLPTEVRRVLDSHSSLRPLVEQTAAVVLETSPLAPDGFSPRAREVRTIVSTRDKLSGKIRVMRVILLPNDADRALLALPSSLHFLYYLVRPIRLSLKYLSVTAGKLSRKFLGNR